MAAGISPTRVGSSFYDFFGSFLFIGRVSGVPYLESLFVRASVAEVLIIPLLC